MPYILIWQLPNSLCGAVVMCQVLLAPCAKLICAGGAFAHLRVGVFLFHYGSLVT